MPALKIIVPFLLLILLSAPAWAYDKIFAVYCKTYGVPLELAVAVAKQESGLNPLCVNVAGKDFTPKTREQAAEIIRKARDENKSYDVGIMQINSQWVKQWEIDPLTLLDPDTNIRLGVRLLKDEISRYGISWQAVGRYHSPNPARARNYAWNVSRRILGNKELHDKIAAASYRGRLRSSGLHAASLPSMLNMPLSSSGVAICAGELGQPHQQRAPVGFAAN